MGAVCVLFVCVCVHACIHTYIDIYICMYAVRIYVCVCDRFSVFYVLSLSMPAAVCVRVLVLVWRLVFLVVRG